MSFLDIACLNLYAVCMRDFTDEERTRMSESLLLPPATPTRRLCIGKPWVELREGSAIQKCSITLGEIEKEVSFSVHEEYGQYLCHERGDAYLIGLLSLAMRERCDICSEVPLTAELVHQIQTELLPALLKYSPVLHLPSIEAELASSPLPSAGKTGTGCSCGIDSLYAIKSLSEDENPSVHLDYLSLNNVGAYTWKGAADTGRQRDNILNAEAFAERYGYQLIASDSNFSEAFPQDHLKTHLYSSCFAIHMLAKLWGRYYYASTGCDLLDYFGLTDNELYDSAKYDLIALPAFSTSRLRICNQAAPVSRFEKTRVLADYEPAWHHLNVCNEQGRGHCGKCPKCMRTLWALDALGKLDHFREVFDIDAYRRNHHQNLRALFRAYLQSTNHLNDEAWEALKPQLSSSAQCRERIKLAFSRHGTGRQLLDFYHRVKG